MKKTLASLIILAMISCNSSNKGKQNNSTKDSIPACLRQEIESIQKKKIEYPPIQIDEYLYKGKKAFLYTADCCDQFNTLFDENCKVICSPSGGIEGGGDFKCPEFSDSAKHVKLIWKKADE